MSGQELLRLRLRDGVPVASLRHLARRAAALSGLQEIDSTRVATAISELARAADGAAALDVEITVQPVWPAASLTVAFTFPGAADAVRADPDLHRTVARLMDDVMLDDDTVTLGKRLPAPLPAEVVSAARDELLQESTVDDRAVLRGINDELADTLIALREREADLTALNLELEETNRGVVALYAELERRSALVRDAQRVVFDELSDALRPPAPDIAGLQLDVRYLPAQTNSPTGGDLYDWFPTDDGCLWITVVDVQGHGVTATRDALRVTHTIRTLILEGHPVTDVLARADAVLQAGSGKVVASAVVVQVDTGRARVEVAAAGHPPVLHVRSDGPPTYLEARGRGIGYEGAGSTGVVACSIAPGDALLLYSDGLIEAERDVIAGMATLAAAAEVAADRDLSGLLDEVLDRCLPDTPLGDDTMLLGMRWSD